VRHDPEANAATYLGGALSPRQARRFEAHLLECESCWQEVTLGRQGRSIMEGARELAPQSLREQVRMAVAGADHRHPRRIGLVVGGAALFVVLAVIGVLVFFGEPAHRGSTSQPVAIAQALADFRDGRLPAGSPRAHRAPDLSGIGFALVGSGGGEVGDIPVDAFGYQDASGRRVLIYLSSRPFPEAVGARLSARPDGPWNEASGGVDIICAHDPLPLLAVSADNKTIRDVASSLGVR